MGREIDGEQTFQKFRHHLSVYYSVFNKHEQQLFNSLQVNQLKKLSTNLDSGFAIYLFCKYKKAYSGKINVSLLVENKHIAQEAKYCENCPLQNRCKNDVEFLKITSIQNLETTISSAACISGH